MLSSIPSIFSNIGMSLENGILLLIVLGGLCFYAKDFKLGVVMHFSMSGLWLIYLWSADRNYTPTMYFFIIMFIMMALSLFAVAQGQRQGQVI